MVKLYSHDSTSSDSNAVTHSNRVNATTIAVNPFPVRPGSVLSHLVLSTEASSPEYPPPSLDGSNSPSFMIGWFEELSPLLDEAELV